MRLSLNWLKDYVDIDMAPVDLGHLLTMAGLEVESIELLGQSLDGIIVAKILEVKPHPQADRLSICIMDTGNEEVPVVCGATNLRVGAKVPMALPCTKIPNGMMVKECILRGERSAGMLCAEDELGLTDDHSGIMILPDDLEVGAGLSSEMNLEDHVFEISLTPNRPDCASVIGIAREVAAFTNKKLRLPELTYEVGDAPTEGFVDIRIEDTKGCPRYSAAVIQGVRILESPFWLRYRLHAAGVRSLNNVVDVTNYVLMEMGQPLHSFDYDLLKGNKIIVRRAKEEETFETLDRKIHVLNSENLLICDGEKPVALAGIMGGLNSEISDRSVNVLLESAFFNPITIRRGSKKLGISTESSYRFERGIDIEGVVNASKRALTLISELAGGTIAKDFIDEYPVSYKPPVINLRVSRTNKILGTSILKETMIGYMKSLEMMVTDSGEDMIQAIPPAFRVDISREADLVEEVARLEGYNNIPVTPSCVRSTGEVDPLGVSLQNQMSDIMVGLGLSEIITYSFISPDSADLLKAEEDIPLRSFIKLMNPLTIDQSVMRTSLVPGLLTTLRHNVSHGETDLKFFEWGKIFMKDSGKDLPVEKLYLSAVMTGQYSCKEWHNERRKVDFFDIKGVADVLLGAVGLDNVSSFKRCDLYPYYSDKSCGIFVSDLQIGSLGEVSVDVVENYDIRTESVFLLELDIGKLSDVLVEHLRRFESFANFPAVLRDISIVVNRRVESASILDIVRNEGKELVESVNIFDLYEGEKIGKSQKALSFRICYRSKQGTLDGREVNQLHESIINKIREKTGGTLREG